MGTEQEAVYIQQLRGAPAFIHSTLRRKEGAVLAVQAVALSTSKSGCWIKHKDNLFLCPFSCDCHFFSRTCAFGIICHIFIIFLNKSFTYCI